MLNLMCKFLLKSAIFQIMGEFSGTFIKDKILDIFSQPLLDTF